MNHAVNLQAREVRQLRQALGMERSELAQELGVTYATIRRWEEGIVRPQPGHLDRLRRKADAKRAARPRA